MKFISLESGRIVIPVLILLCVVFSSASSAQNADEVSQRLVIIREQIYVDPLEAHQYLLSVEEEIASHPLDTQSLFYLRKAQVELLLYRFNDFSETIGKGASLVNETTPEQISIWYGLYQCLIYEHNANYDRATACYQDAANDAHADEDVEAEVYALQELAYVQVLDESYEASMFNLQQARNIATQSQQMFLTAMVDKAFGAVHAYLGEFEKSERYFASALKSYGDMGLKAYRAETLYDLANTYRAWGESELALTHYHASGEIFTYGADSHHEFLSWYGVAMTLADMGKCSLSLNAIDQALAYTGIDDFKIEIYKKQALCLVEMDSITQARESLEMAKALSGQILMLSDTTWQLELLQLEAVILAAEGDFQKAFANMAQFHESYLRRYEEHASRRMVYMQNTMDSRGKDLEIERLQKQTLLDEISLDNQQQENEIQKYLTIIWLVILLGFLLFIVYQRRITRDFKNLSYQDSLTQLYNRRFIFNLMDNLIAKMPSGKGQLSIIMMDVDNFKHINDTYGHATGDKVLCKMSEVCQTALRHGNDIGRIGGEEFLVVVPRESEHQTRLIAERLRTTIEKSYVMSDNNVEIRFTVSIGVAQLNKECMDTATLFKTADEALYRAKQEGKNRIVEYHTLVSQPA